MTERLTVSVDVVSDVVCPWCYIGARRLDKAIALAGDVEVAVNWRPYQLDPSIPAQGVERRAYMLAKFGSEERLAEIHRHVSDEGASAGIDFAFDRIAVSPNTLDAHRLIRWSASAEGGSVQDAVVRALFRAFFEEGRDIGDRFTLVEIGVEAGMDAAIVETLFQSGADIEAVKAEIAVVQRMGVRGVPCYLLEGRYAVMGAQDPQTLADALTQVAGAKSRGEIGDLA